MEAYSSSVNNEDKELPVILVRSQQSEEWILVSLSVPDCQSNRYDSSSAEGSVNTEPLSEVVKRISSSTPPSDPKC